MVDFCGPKQVPVPIGKNAENLFLALTPRGIQPFGKPILMETKIDHWIPLPDPITESQVKIELTWHADERTRQALERQAKCLGVPPDEYLRQAVAFVLATDEANTAVPPLETRGGRNGKA